MRLRSFIVVIVKRSTTRKGTQKQVQQGCQLGQDLEPWTQNWVTLYLLFPIKTTKEKDTRHPNRHQTYNASAIPKELVRATAEQKGHIDKTEVKVCLQFLRESKLE